MTYALCCHSCATACDLVAHYPSVDVSSYRDIALVPRLNFIALITLTENLGRLKARSAFTEDGLTPLANSLGRGR
jgi:hypothetical protein